MSALKQRTKVEAMKTSGSSRSRIVSYTTNKSGNAGYYVTKKKVAQKGAQPEALDAELIKVTDRGLCFVVDNEQRTHAFRLDRLQGYKGEPIDEIGLREGSKLRVMLKFGRILNARLV